MIRLVFGDLLAQSRVWTGMTAVVVATGFVAAIAAGLIETGAVHGGKVQEGLSSTSGAVIIFTTATALIVLSGAANLTVSLQQRGYALWQVVGIRPALVGLVVYVQLGIVALVGAGAGLLIALPAFPVLFGYVFRTWDGMQGISLHLGGMSAIWVLLSVLGVVLLGGLRGARRASRVPPVEVLREPEMPRARVEWFRYLLLAAALFGLLSVIMNLRRDASLAATSGTGLFLTPLIAVVFAAAGPLLYPVVLRAWTALVPRNVSASWFFARHSARFRLSRSSAAIGPLMVAIALTGGLYTLARSIDAAQHRSSGTLAPEGVVILLGGPLLLAAVAAAATVFMSGQAREREFALLQAAGATRAMILLASLWEALIYAFTAAMLGGLATVIGGVIIADVLGLDAPVITMESSLVVAVGGFAALLIATIAPTCAALRHDIPRTLAVE
ncbi:FtsX-like permease family protein [Microbacterium murale]|uniref:ABC transport system permease protein n=1 Tax=Microbacterium murale TaxID=1081040 RepID=A0ABU0PEI7_9MICO|nr:FtsX-like permease family protein [Microbacterium murale]MDQ0645738.1 putative ABC transport system permease protein [Microbacterium murale]